MILVDDASTDGARDSGIDHATGQYIMFIDCDDTIHDDMVESLLSRAYAEDDDICMCAHNLSKEKSG